MKRWLLLRGVAIPIVRLQISRCLREAKFERTGIIIYKQRGLLLHSELLVLRLVQDISILTAGISIITPQVGLSSELSLQGNDSKGKNTSHGSNRQTHEHG